MLYGKLPVVLLGTVTAEKPGTAGYTIAYFLLSHPEQAAAMGIEELAQTCHVSLSSVSRFCREVGLEDFSELHRILLEETQAREQVSFPAADPEIHTEIDRYCMEVGMVVRQTGETIDREGIRDLCRKIHQYKRVFAFGPMKAETAAICLQSDLFLLGKDILTCVPLEQQRRVLMQEGKDTLILLFSCSGAYFSYFTSFPVSLLDVRNRPHIWMVAGEPPRDGREVLERVIRYDALLNRQTHPYPLMAAAGMIAQEYEALFGKEK